VYGLNQGESGESSSPAPFNDYGKSKLLAEGMLEAWSRRETGRRLVIIRLAATFGPGNRGNIHRMLAEIRHGRFVIVGSGRNRKSIAYVKNVAAFLARCRGFPTGTTILNYADKPDLTTAELVETVRQALGRPGAGPRVPLAVGLAGGVALELLKNRDPRAVPVVLSRIRKFSANTIVQTGKLQKVGFRPPFSLQQGLRETVAAEFGAPG
jgi:nucleoside-diphosphate-sugar epimerase